MAKAAWGTKQTCPKCGERFYDLGNADPVVCIGCGNEWVPEPILKARQPVAVAPAPEKKPRPESDDDDDDDIKFDDDSDDDVEVASDDDDDDTLVDVSLDDEDADLSDVVDTKLSDND